MNQMWVIVGLAAWLAFVTGGFVWFAWGIGENVVAKVAGFRAARAAAKVKEPAGDDA